MTVLKSTLGLVTTSTKAVGLSIDKPNFCVLAMTLLTVWQLLAKANEEVTVSKIVFKALRTGFHADL
jgi:hypothetical protein